MTATSDRVFGEAGLPGPDDWYPREPSGHDLGPDVPLPPSLLSTASCRRCGRALRMTAEDVGASLDGGVSCYACDQPD